MAKYYGPELPLNLGNNQDFIYLEDFSLQIKQKLKMLLLTNPGEKIMFSDFGCGLRKYLFENIDKIINVTKIEDYVDSIEEKSASEVIKEKIEEQVSKYLKDIQITNIDISFEENSMNLKIEYMIEKVIEDSYEISIG